MRYLTAPFILIGLLMLSACGGITQPSEEDIKSMAAEHFDQQYAGLFTVSQVEKLNGYKNNDTHYVAEMRISATAQRSLDDYARNLMGDDTLSALEKMTMTMTIGLLKVTLPEFEAGDVITFEKDYLFINTDNGWLLKKEMPKTAQ